MFQFQTSSSHWYCACEHPDQSRAAIAMMSQGTHSSELFSKVPQFCSFQKHPLVGVTTAHHACTAPKASLSYPQKHLAGPLPPLRAGTETI